MLGLPYAPSFTRIVRIHDQDIGIIWRRGVLQIETIGDERLPVEILAWFNHIIECALHDPTIVVCETYFWYEKAHEAAYDKMDLDITASGVVTEARGTLNNAGARLTVKPLSLRQGLPTAIVLWVKESLRATILERCN